MGKSCQIEFWQAQLVDNPALLFYPSKCDITRPPNFQKFLQTAEECCNRNICWTCYKLVSLVKSGIISGPSCSFMCVKVVIQYLTCGFRLVNSTRQNVMSRGLPILGSFCRPLRNVVTETFAEPSEIWEVSSNRILAGTISRPSCPFICVKLLWFDVRFPTCLYYQSKCDVTRPPIFESCCKRLRNFVTFQSVSLFRKQERIINRSTIA